MIIRILEQFLFFNFLHPDINGSCVFPDSRIRLLISIFQSRNEKKKKIRFGKIQNIFKFKI